MVLRKECGRAVLLMVALFWGTALLAAEEPAKTVAAAPQKDYVAIVKGHKIGMGEYAAALRRAAKDRFYHGKTPEEEVKAFRKEIAEQLVQRALLAAEAEQRKIEPDHVEVDKGVSAYDARFTDNEEWPKHRERVLAELRKKLEADSRVKRLEEQVRTVSIPTDVGLKEYYASHSERFTTPEQIRVSVIMLRVDPSSGSKMWAQAGDEAAAIVERLNNGADFSELARIHSSDESASKGGDMGSVHAGMLGTNAQAVLELMEPGEVSAPVVMLEGIAVFRLADRTAPVLNPYAKVKSRAENLYRRDKGEEAWKGLMARLVEQADIEYNDAPWR